MTVVTGTAPQVTDDDDDDDRNGVMVALLPTTSDWCRIDLPHLTLVYAGTTDKITPTQFNDLSKDASMIATLAKPLYARVMGLDVFGDDTEKVNVLKLQPTPELWALHRALDEWDSGDYPFVPHCTIGPVELGVPSVIPSAIGFNRVYASYGTEGITFNLGGPSAY